MNKIQSRRRSISVTCVFVVLGRIPLAVRPSIGRRERVAFAALVRPASPTTRSKRKGNDMSGVAIERKRSEHDEGAAQRNALVGTNTRDIQAGLEKYLATKRIDALFTSMTESVLLFQPDNPIRFIRRHLLDNYPNACRDEGESDGLRGSSTAKGQVDLIGRSEEEESDDELSDDEFPLETSVDSGEDSKRQKEADQIMARHGKYVRLLKGMPMFNPKARRRAVASSTETRFEMRRGVARDEKKETVQAVGCFGSGENRKSVSASATTAVSKGEKASSFDGDEIETTKTENGEEEDEEEEHRTQFLDVIRERAASQLFFKFLTKHDKAIADTQVRFLLAVVRYKNKWKTLRGDPRALEERATDMLNEYIIRGSERMIPLEDRERREIGNLVKSPSLNTFDLAQEKVIERMLQKIHRPGKKSSSLFGLFLDHVRNVEGMLTKKETGEGGELPPPDVTRDGILRILQQHPLFAHLPIRVLESLTKRFVLQRFECQSSVVEPDNETDDRMYIVASGRCEVYLKMTPEEAEVEVRRLKKKSEGKDDLLKRMLQKKNGNNANASLSMKDSPVLKRILGHVDLTRFKWYGWAGPAQTIRAVAVLHNTPPNVWVRGSPEEMTRLWCVRREDVRDAVKEGMKAHRLMVAQKLREASTALKHLTPIELDAIAPAVREVTYSGRQRIVARGTRCERLIVVLEGAMHMMQDSTVISTLGPGDVCGDFALLARGRRSCVDVIAAPDVACEEKDIASMPSGTNVDESLIHSAVRRGDVRVRCLIVTRRSVERAVGPLLPLIRTRDIALYRRLVSSIST